MSQLPSSVAAMPSDFTRIKAIFIEIVSEPWFNEDPRALQAFGSFLIHSYCQGLVNRDNFHDFARTAALGRYSKAASKDLAWALKETLWRQEDADAHPRS